MPNAKKDASGLTAKQRVFVEHHANGVRQGEAARLAGYVKPDTDAHRLKKNPAVQKALQAERQAKLQGPIGNMALDRLTEALKPGALPLKDQFQYVKLGLALAGHDPKTPDNKAPGDKPSADWTADQLAEYIARLSEALDGASAPMLDITPSAEAS